MQCIAIYACDVRKIEYIPMQWSPILCNTCTCGLKEHVCTYVCIVKAELPLVQYIYIYTYVAV